MRRNFVIAVALLATIAMASAAPTTHQSEQLIVVTAEDWNANHGTLVTFERESDRQWKRVMSDVPVMLGRNGLAWGIGLNSHEATKREGDGRSPAGVFDLERIYTVDAKGLTGAFPYFPLTETSEGIDDPESRYYNRIVDSVRVTNHDWASSEKLRPANPMFRWLVNVKHNWQQRPGYGSCIYLHIWKAPGVATSGCTAMSVASLQRIVQWLDAKKKPLLVQLTREDYAQWDLPL